MSLVDLNEMSKVLLLDVKIINDMIDRMYIFQEYIAWKQETLANQTGHLEVLSIYL